MIIFSSEDFGKLIMPKIRKKWLKFAGIKRICVNLEPFVLSRNKNPKGTSLFFAY